MVDAEHGGVGCEVNVCNQRYDDLPLRQFPANLGQYLRIANRRHRESHDFAIDSGEGFDLIDGRAHIARVGVGHRLDAQGVGPADAHRTDFDFPGRATAPGEEISRVGIRHGDQLAPTSS